MPSDWGYWTSTSSTWTYSSSYQVLYEYIEDLMEEEEPKEKQLGFFDE